jgi:hypothetical protein
MVCTATGGATYAMESGVDYRNGRIHSLWQLTTDLRRATGFSSGFTTKARACHRAITKQLRATPTDHLKGFVWMRNKVVK